jgi:hypothetical protein
MNDSDDNQTAEKGHKTVSGGRKVRRVALEK